MTVPREERHANHTLKAVRLALQMSQSEFATAVRMAGAALGEPNTCNKRRVQKWESGEHRTVRPNYKRALSAVARAPFEQLGFATEPTPTLPVIIATTGRPAETTEVDTHEAEGAAAERLWAALECQRRRNSPSESGFVAVIPQALVRDGRRRASAMFTIGITVVPRLL